MKTFKIKVEFARIYEIEAEDNHEAQTKAQSQAVEEIEKFQDLYDGEDLINRLLKTEVYQEPTDWSNQAKEEGKRFASDIEDEIKLVVENWQKENTEDIKKGEKIPEMDENEKDEIVNTIFDKLYQDEDIHYKVTEYADGQFIYNDRESIKEALDCIDELSAFEETDSGLWEGMKTIEEQLNARATYTYANAIYDSAERVIRERITELLECSHSNCDDEAKCIQCGEQQ